MNPSNPITVGDYQYEISEEIKEDNFILNVVTGQIVQTKIYSTTQLPDWKGITATNNPDLNKQGVPGLTERNSKVHYLKTVNPYFVSVWHGFKKFELRVNDRDFKVGDEVYLQEYDADKKEYSGRQVRADINFVLKDYPGIESGYVIFSFTKTQHLESSKTFKSANHE